LGAALVIICRPRYCDIWCFGVQQKSGACQQKKNQTVIFRLLWAYFDPLWRVFKHGFQRIEALLAETPGFGANGPELGRLVVRETDGDDQAPSIEPRHQSLQLLEDNKVRGDATKPFRIPSARSWHPVWPRSISSGSLSLPAARLDDAVFLVCSATW